MIYPCLEGPERLLFAVKDMDGNTPEGETPPGQYDKDRRGTVDDTFVAVTRPAVTNDLRKQRLKNTLGFLNTMAEDGGIGDIDEAAELIANIPQPITRVVYNYKYVITALDKAVEISLPSDAELVDITRIVLQSDTAGSLTVRIGSNEVRDSYTELGQPQDIRLPPNPSLAVRQGLELVPTGLTNAVVEIVGNLRVVVFSHKNSGPRGVG